MGHVRVRLHGMEEDIDEFLQVISPVIGGIAEVNRIPCTASGRVIANLSWENPNVSKEDK